MKGSRPVLATLATLAALVPALALAKAPLPAQPSLLHVASEPKPGAIGTDLAFWGHLVFAGNFEGFRIFDATRPAGPRLLSDVRCHGPQGDLSVWRNVLVVSVDTPQTSAGCDSQDAPDATDISAFEGIRIFDVSDPAQPRLVATVPTDCGSHTNTLVPDVAHGRLLVYVSSYAARPGPHCGAGREPDPLHGNVSIVSVPLGDPASAAIVAMPAVHAVVWHPSAQLGPTIGCHDISVFLPLHLAAASCITEAQIWDLSKPLHPRVLARIHNSSFAFFHSATFTWDGKILVLGDESFQGSCANPTGAEDGRLWFYSIAKPAHPKLLSSFTIPRRLVNQDCSVHMFDVVPTTKRYLLSAAWYEGGTDLVDFTDPRQPRELAFFTANPPESTNTWASYWYDGAVYANDINRGVDVFSVPGAAALQARTLDHLNPQVQELLLPQSR